MSLQASINLMMSGFLSLAVLALLIALRPKSGNRRPARVMPSFNSWGIEMAERATTRGSTSSGGA